jgi:hypothetical protein
MLLRLLSAAVLAVGLAAPASAGEKLIQKVYHVADLVVPIPNADTVVLTKSDCSACPAAKKEQTLEAELMKLIQYTVAPGTWSEAGGPGKLDYYPPAYALVATHSPEVHEELGGLLETMRKLQERSITFDVKLIQVPEEAFERIGVDFDLEGNGGSCKTLSVQTRCVQDPLQCLALAARWLPQRAIVLSEQQAFRVLEGLQKDRRASILTQPKVTMQEGQPAYVQCETVHHFVTDMKEMKVNGQTVWSPVQTSEVIGNKFGLQGSVTTDGKLVCVHVKGSVSTLDPEVPLVPVTSFITPVFEGGSAGQPIPFTQFIQKPRIEKLTVEKTLAIPNGGTALIHCGEITTTTRTECGSPVLSKIPYVNRLFKNVGCGRETCHLLMLVTPRVRIGCGEEQAECKPTVGGCLGNGIGAVLGTVRDQGCCAAAKCATTTAACATPCQASAAKPQAAPRGSLTLGIGINSKGGLQGTIVLSGPPGEAKCCVEASPCPFAEIVEMTQAGVSEDVIINQIRTTGVRYTLTGAQIVQLHRSGVGERVIIEMQNTRFVADPVMTTGQLAPTCR